VGWLGLWDGLANGFSSGLKTGVAAGLCRRGRTQVSDVGSLGRELCTGKRTGLAVFPVIFRCS